MPALQFDVSFDESTLFARLVVNLAAIDPIVGETARAIGASSRVAYKAASPSQRMAKAVSTKQRKRGTERVVQTGIAEKPMGAPVHGRDPGTQAIARWTDRGTAEKGTGRIYRTTLGPDGTPLPFYFTGRPIPWVRGQKPQAWVKVARDASDVATEMLALNMGDRIAERLAS